MADAISEDTRPKRISRRAIHIALWALPLAALANIAFFLWTLDGRPLSSIAEAPSLLLLAAGLSIVPWLTNVARLAIWCRFLGVKLGLAANIRIILGTVIANSITPTATGGTVIKWGFLVNEGVSPDKSSTIISMQIAEDTTVLLSLLAIALFFALGFELPATLRSSELMTNAQDTTQNALLSLLTIVLLAISLYAAARNRLLGERMAGWSARSGARIAEMFGNVAEDFRMIARSGKGVVLASMGLAVIQWGARYSVAAAVIGFAGAQVLPLLYWALQWLTFTFSTMVPTPGGIGGTEAAFLLLYAPFISPEKLGPIMVIWRLVMFYVPVALAAIVFLGLRGRVGARPV